MTSRTAPEMRDYPWTTAYIALVVTVILLLTLLEHTT